VGVMFLLVFAYANNVHLKVSKIWFKILLKKVADSRILLLIVWVKNKTN
jgi:hypothetical protein